MIYDQAIASLGENKEQALRIKDILSKYHGSIAKAIIQVAPLINEKNPEELRKTGMTVYFSYLLDISRKIYKDNSIREEDKLPGVVTFGMLAFLLSTTLLDDKDVDEIRNTFPDIREALDLEIDNHISEILKLH
jgi:hypothetical protein